MNIVILFILVLPERWSGRRFCGIVDLDQLALAFYPSVVVDWVKYFRLYEFFNAFQCLLSDLRRDAIRVYSSDKGDPQTGSKLSSFLFFPLGISSTLTFARSLQA